MGVRKAGNASEVGADHACTREQIHQAELHTATNLGGLSETCGTGLPMESLYADDLSHTVESVKELEEKMVKWQRSLEKKWLKVNRAKTEVLVSSRGT